MTADQLIVALDVPTAVEARRLTELLAPVGCRWKVGIELFNSCGPEIVTALGAGQIFLDLKFHDLPNTVAGAARAAARLGVWMFNLHSSGGVEMMAAGREAAEGEAQRLGTRRPLVIGVTVLTSLNREMMNRELAVPGALEAQVEQLARMALKAGLDGVVCSPQEAKLIRGACGNSFIIVTPGVRPAGTASQDQQRTTTPRAALAAGANYLVVGRPITQAADPAAAARRILAESD